MSQESKRSSFEAALQLVREREKSPNASNVPKEWEHPEWDAESYQVGDNDPVLTFKKALEQWHEQGGEFTVNVIEHTGEVEGGGRDEETGCWEGGDEEIKIHTYRWEDWSDAVTAGEWWNWSDDPINTETDTVPWEG